jgi:hypothetical protein
MKLFMSPKLEGATAWRPQYLQRAKLCRPRIAEMTLGHWF